jgi:tRNA 2-selenouridine synthase SelU
MQERTLPKERKKERWTRGMGSEEVKEAKEEAKAKPAVASSGDLSFEALLAKHRAQQSKTKEVEIEDVRESEMDAKEALEAKRTAEDCFAVHELYQEMKKVLQEMLMGLLRSWKN